MSFNVEESAVFIHEFSKKISLPWEGGHPPPPARSLRSLALAPPPLLKNPGYASGLTLLNDWILNFKLQTRMVIFLRSTQDTLALQMPQIRTKVTLGDR